MEKITPRVDIAFKKIFGVEENKDLLMLLINSIVSQEDQVADITLLNPWVLLQEWGKCDQDHLFYHYFNHSRINLKFYLLKNFTGSHLKTHDT